MRPLAILAALFLLTACPDHEQKQPPASGGGGETQKKIALKPPPAEKAQRPQGMTAIKVAHAGEITKSEVVEYFKTHNLPMMTSTPNFQVDAVESLTAKQVSDRLQGEPTGLADNDRVAFVTLAGTFTFTGPPKSRPASFKRAYAVFDATNGNLMMVGSLEASRETSTTTAKP